jgi:hypothetical protein
MDDAYTTDEDMSLNVAAPGVLGNDSDADGDPLTASLVSDVSNGTLSLASNGSFSYTPNSDFNGSDSFVYEVCDTGFLCDTATVTITITAATTTTVEVRVAASSDDAEERASENVSLGSSDLELVFDNNGNQTVGMRFNGLSIPSGATITKAYVQFQTDKTHSDPTSLTVQGEGVDNATTFVKTKGNISTRPRTAAAVSWSPNPWLTVGEAGLDQQTPDIASVIQEIVNRTGWASGNSLVIIITGTGKREAEAFDGDAAGAPLLHVEYTSGS